MTTEATTDLHQTRRVDGVQVRLGHARWTVPLAKLAGIAALACAAAWGAVKTERDDLRASDAAMAERLARVEAQLATEQVVLADIRAQLARIDARVAEVQVTLMRGGR